MAEITKELGRIPVSRGDYQATVEYYKDNIVQYKRGSYQVVSESPIIGIPPTNDKNVVNPGWTLFAGTLDAQDVVNQIKEQEAQSIQAVADREAEILAKSDASEISSTTIDLEGSNVEDKLTDAGKKLSELKENVTNINRSFESIEIDIAPVSVIMDRKIIFDGAIEALEASKISVFDIEEGQSIHVTSPYKGDTGAYLFAFYNSKTIFNSSTLVKIGPEINANNDLVAVAPKGAVALLFQSRFYYDSTTTIKGITQIIHTKNIEELSSKLEKVENELNDSILKEVESSITPSSIISNKKIEYNGVVSSLEASSISVFDVVVGQKLRMRSPNKGDTGAYLYAFYNSESVFDSSTLVKIGPEINAENDDIIEVPNNAIKLLFQSRFNYDSNGFTINGYTKELPFPEASNKFYNISGRIIKVNSKYSNVEDIQVELAPLGINSIVQINRFGYIPNMGKSVLQSNPSIYVNSGTDWICPYSMWSLDGSTYGQGAFTGGCHGSNGDATGEPTARTKDVKVYVDNMLVKDNTSGYAHNVRVVVTNEIMAGNTLDNTESGKTGYYCVEEEVTYDFVEDKILVSVLIKALHNINIINYYGTGVSAFTSSVSFFGEDILDSDFSGTTKYTKRCNAFICGNGSGKFVVAKLNDVGLAKRECSFYAHSYSYGKAYFCFVSEMDSPIHMDKGQRMYWNGYLQFTDREDILGV